LSCLDTSYTDTQRENEKEKRARFCSTARSKKVGKSESQKVSRKSRKLFLVFLAIVDRPDLFLQEAVSGHRDLVLLLEVFVLLPKPAAIPDKKRLLGRINGLFNKLLGNALKESPIQPRASDASLGLCRISAPTPALLGLLGQYATLTKLTKCFGEPSGKFLA